MSEPGKIESAPVRWRFQTRCGECNFPFVRDADRQVDFHVMLRDAGWRDTKLFGWMCRYCRKGRKRIESKYKNTTQQRVLDMLLVHRRKWSPKKFAEELGVTATRVHQIKDELIRKGLLEPDLARRNRRK